VSRALAVLVALAIPTAMQAAEAPKALYGKSVALSWVEERQQSSAAEPQPRWLRVPLTLTIYVSTAGRIFTRITGSTAGSARPGSAEALGANATTNAGIRVAQFKGRSLTYTSTFTGGARNISVEFDDSHGTCTVSVILGKSPGASKIVMPNLALGGVVEVHAVTIRDTSCAIRDGNALSP
jgi:hypothetical protein